MQNSALLLLLFSRLICISLKTRLFLSHRARAEQGRRDVNLRSGVFFFFFEGRTRREEKKITRERHKGIIGRGHDLRLP